MKTCFRRQKDFQNSKRLSKRISIEYPRGLSHNFLLDFNEQHLENYSFKTLMDYYIFKAINKYIGNTKLTLY